MSVVTILGAIAAVVALAALLYRPQAGIAGIVLFYPFWFFAPRFPVPGMNVETALLGLAIALTVVRFGARIPPLRYSLPVIAFVILIAAAASISMSSIANESSRMGPLQIFLEAKSNAFTALMFFLGYWWFADGWDRRKILETISFALGIVAVATITDFVVGFTQAGAFGRATGIFDNPNSTAATLVTFMFVCLYLMRSPDLSRMRRQIHGAVYLVIWLALILGQSRSAWTAALAGHAVWLFFVNRRVLVLGAFATVLAATVAFPLLPDVVRDRITMTTNSGSVGRFRGTGTLEDSSAERIVIYRAGLEMFRDSPLWGHGLNGVYLLTPQYAGKWGLHSHRSAHSLFIKLAAETGLIGLGVMSWIILVVTGLGRGLRRWSHQDPDLGSLLITCGVTILVGGLTHTVFILIHAQSAYFWLLFGMAAQFYHLGDEIEEAEVSESAEPVLAYGQAPLAPDLLTADFGEVPFAVESPRAPVPS